MQDRWQVRSEILILLLLLAATGLAYASHWSFTVDDAAISFSYARNFAQGHGLGALYPGAPRVEGYSNLLWVILLAAGTWLGVDTLLVSKVLGLTFTLGVMVMLYLSLREFIRNRWLLLGLALLPISLTYTFWSVSGLENALYAFLILLSVFFLIREDKFPAQIPLGSALSLVLVGMTRPEGLVYVLAGLGYKIIQLAIRWRQVENSRLLVKNLLSWLAIFLLGYGIFKAWHYAYFAAWWPNPIYAKAGWYQTDLKKIWFDPGGWTYLRGYFRTFAAVGMIPALLFGGVVSLKGSQRIFPIFALASLALPLYTFDWMLNYRFLYPFVPFAIALLILAADQIWTWIYDFWRTRSSERSTFNVQRLTFVSALVLTVWFGFTIARFAWVNLRLTERQLACGYAPMAETRCLDGKMYWSMGEVDQKYRELESYAAKIGLDDPLYMIPDIGATSYLQNKRILDLAGLADYQLARIREGSLLKQYIFSEQRPDFVMTYGIWTRRTDLTNFSAFHENYLPIVQGQDENGLLHGTYVRKDLLVGPASTPFDKYMCELAPGLYLVSIPAEASNPLGSSMEVLTGIDSVWLASQPQGEDWSMEVVLLDQDGVKVYTRTEPLGYGWYSTSQWQPDELFRQYIPLPADLPAGGYTVSLRLVGSSAAPSTEDKEPLCSTEIYLHDQTEDQGQVSDQLDEYILQNLLIEAQSAWNTGDLEVLLSSLREKDALPPAPEWLAFGRELRQAASLAAQHEDWKRAYQLYLAAALANPTDAWAQRGLEQARRNYLLGDQA